MFSFLTFLFLYFQSFLCYTCIAFIRGKNCLRIDWQSCPLPKLLPGAPGKDNEPNVIFLRVEGENQTIKKGRI